MVKALLDRNETCILLHDFLEEFQNCVNQTIEPTTDCFEKYLNPHFKICSNGKVLANDLTGYLAEIKDFQRRYTHCEINLNDDEVICSEHALACYYQADLTTRKGQRHKIYMMIIAKIEHGKLTSWKQVSHENSIEHWA